MNGFFISAGIFLFISLLIHMIAGDKEYRELNPGKNTKLFSIWLMGRGTFQMVSVDLLLSAIFIFLMGTATIPYNHYLSLFVALLYSGYLLFWLITLLVSGARPFHYLRVGQWIIFLIAFVLIILGMK